MWNKSHSTRTWRHVTKPTLLGTHTRHPQPGRRPWRWQSSGHGAREPGTSRRGRSAAPPRRAPSADVRKAQRTGDRGPLPPGAADDAQPGPLAHVSSHPRQCRGYRVDRLIRLRVGAVCGIAMQPPQAAARPAPGHPEALQVGEWPGVAGGRWGAEVRGPHSGGGGRGVPAGHRMAGAASPREWKRCWAWWRAVPSLR